MTEARGLWSRLRKSELIDTAIENAQTAQAGIEAGLRAEFKTLYRARRSKKMRGFSDAEMSAIKSVATGDVTTNTLRRIGSLSGGVDQSRNMLNLLGGVGAGAYVGGPIGAVAVPAAAYGAQRLAKARTGQSAALARAITARGETPRQAATMPPAGQFGYPSGAAPIAAPVALGAQRSQDPRRRPGKSTAR